MSPLNTRATLAVFGALSLSLFQAACSASDPGGGGSANTAGSSPSGAGAVGAPGSAAGSSNGGAGAVGGGGASASGGAVATAGAPSAGAGGALSSAGASGNPSGGSGGAAVQCTPGTGTTPVGDKSVTDNKTCLTWTKVRSAMPMTNKLAAKYCADLDQDGISAWRVPRPEELVTWPDLSTDSTSYITGPIYIPTAAANDSDGCTGDSHSCNIAKYNDASVTCGWQGVGFQGWVECVSGTPAAGTTKAAYSAATCSPCSGELASFKETDCSAYTN